MERPKFTSKAYWPKGSLETFKAPTGVDKENEATFCTHWEREEALRICEGLKKDGFGKLGKVFPLKVELIEEI